MAARYASGSSPRAALYNDGNDDISTMNRFAFPSISFSPSFPMSMSPSTPRIASANGKLDPSPPASAFNVLSPRSAHRGGGGLLGSGTGGIASTRAGGGILRATPSPGGTSSGSNSSISPANQMPSYFSPASSNESAGLLGGGLATSLDSPLPPLSPHGQKLADAESYHNAKCLNRIVEKRRKASDGTGDIVAKERPPLLMSHSRRVSFQVAQEDRENAKAAIVAEAFSDGSLCGILNKSSSALFEAPSAD